MEALLRQLVKETGNLPLTEKAGEGVPLCMVNTELNSGNFLIDPQGVSSLVDWEKPLVSEPARIWAISWPYHHFLEDGCDPESR